MHPVAESSVLGELYVMAPAEAAAVGPLPAFPAVPVHTMKAAMYVRSDIDRELATLETMM